MEEIDLFVKILVFVKILSQVGLVSRQKEEKEEFQAPSLLKKDQRIPFWKRIQKTVERTQQKSSWIHWSWVESRSLLSFLNKVHNLHKIFYQPSQHSHNLKILSGRHLSSLPFYYLCVIDNCALHHFTVARDYEEATTSNLGISTDAVHQTYLWLELRINLFSLFTKDSHEKISHHKTLPCNMGLNM